MSGKSTRTTFAAMGGCLAGAVIVFVCVAIALVLYWQRDFLLGLVAPPPTPTRAATMTATPVPPTATAAPTLTSTPDPARVFGGPILAEIANRPPDYQDDFSNPSSGWETGRQKEGCCAGARNYDGGQFVLIVDPLPPDQTKDCDGYSYINSSNWELVSGLDDYVFEVEQNWVQGSGWTMIYLYDDEVYGYAIRLVRPGRAGGFWLEGPVAGPDTAVQFTNDLLFPFRATEQGRIRITFIIQGQEFAIFADGEPVYYSTLSGHRKVTLKMVQFHILNNSSAVPFEIHWDNLKIWDLNR
ncbi:MAG: hypothetical protein FD146_1863 [Anaerolineaceae bacterium]|nr:MAG: hypothetical protein FD146_1863 [Anaerolineaceae bacterium]